VESQDDRIAERLAKIRAQEHELDRESADRARRAASPESPIAARQGSPLRSTVFLVALLLVTAALVGCAVTLSRLAGNDMTDAKRTGQATVTACSNHGPITNRGFGSWQRCTATIAWDDGQTSRITVDAVFTSADIGRTVRVGDLGAYRTSPQLARADDAPRPWLRWIGYASGALAFVPGLIVVLLLRELVRFRRR
jgi:hypothetical protein